MAAGMCPAGCLVGSMKKSLMLAAAAAVLACSAAAQAAVYKVGTHPTFAPFEFVDEQGTATGFDVDLINAVLQSQGDTVEIVSMPFDGLIPALLTGQIDAIISGMTITEERQKRVDFSTGYYNSTLSAVIRSSDAASFTDSDALKGQKICAQIGTTGSAFAEKLSPGQVVNMNTEPDALLELKNGGCAALINDRPVNLYYIKQAGDDSFAELIDDALTSNPDLYGIAVRKDNAELLQKINQGLIDIKESGELKAVHEKWFGVAPE